MKTNPDPFENKLGALQRRALPEDWKVEILSAAVTVKRVPRTPRWLLAGWGSAWAAILVMYFTTPAEPATAPQIAQPVLATSPALWAARAATIESLLATN